MTYLNEQQLEHAKEVMREYLSAPADSEGKSPAESNRFWDQERLEVINTQLSPLLSGYFEGEITLDDFKSRIDSINKRNQLWGFKGIKGQMFFNMVINVADDIDECDQELKAALKLPNNEPIASSRIKTFTHYIKRLGDQWVEAGNTRYGTPKVGSIPFFLSYFWQIQDYKIWPVYYTSSVRTMTDLNLWQPREDQSENYLVFKRIHEELARVFTEVSGVDFDLYEVEHVFWHKAGNPYTTPLFPEKDESEEETGTAFNNTIISPPKTISHLPESYVPPIISILPGIARNETVLEEAAKRSGTNLARAFEKSINVGFTILGYETKLLGQGKGRVPDGLALALDDSYAIFWDAKVRTESYSMGTDDRIIREYITTQSRDLKRRRSLRNTYYVVISSCFSDDFDDTIRSIKMDTDISEVCLIEAEALVAMIDIKLREPLQITLGPDGFQRLFTFSGIITSSSVRELFI